MFSLTTTTQGPGDAGRPVTPQFVWLRTEDGTLRRFVLEAAPLPVRDEGKAPDPPGAVPPGDAEPFAVRNGSPSTESETSKSSPRLALVRFTRRIS